MTEATSHLDASLLMPSLSREPAEPSRPVLPPYWQCTALLHPYSPAPANDRHPNVPFFQLCVANIGYIEGQVMSAQLTGVEDGRIWWYKITPSGTTVSIDRGATWNRADMGWTLPSTHWLPDAATWFAASQLNWMAAQ